MNKLILEKIFKQAKLDELRRKDPRYLRTMSFLVKKGVLISNKNYDQWYRGKLYFKDALWTGKNLEPRVLEVLPAVALRLPKEIIYNDVPKAFLNAVEAMKNNKAKGPDFMGVPYLKYKVWLNLKLNDKRTKPLNQKKIMKSFRLSPSCITKLEDKIKETGMSGSQIIESLLNR